MLYLSRVSKHVLSQDNHSSLANNFLPPAYAWIKGVDASQTKGTSVSYIFHISHKNKLSHIYVLSSGPSICFVPVRREITTASTKPKTMSQGRIVQLIPTKIPCSMALTQGRVRCQLLPKKGRRGNSSQVIS